MQRPAEDPTPSQPGQQPLPSTGDDAAAVETSVPDDGGAPIDDATPPPPPPPPDDAAVTPPACGAPPAEPPSTTTPLPVDEFPMIRHWERPRTPNTIALTFDDGPNPPTTNRILDALKAEGVRATFFINTRATLDVRTSSEAHKTLQRIVDEGHVLGNHTGAHLDLTLMSTDVDAQLRAVEDDLKALVPCAPPLTLVRAPYGQPYLSGTEDAKARVYPIVARHGVHVGWTIETRDFECGNAACVLERALRWYDMTTGEARRGPILLHDTQPATADAVPTLIAELKKRGVTFVTAEKLVRDKYGKPSAELVKR